MHNQEVWKTVFGCIFRHPNIHFITGKLTLWTDGWMPQCHPVICAWTAVYIETIHLQWIMPHHCPVCEAPNSSFEAGDSLFQQLSGYRLYFQKSILCTQEDKTERKEARKYLDDCAVGTSDGHFWNMYCTSPTTVRVPDLLRTIYLGVLEHWMDWVASSLEQHSGIDKFNQLWVRMPPYSDFTRFDKPYSQVMQWGGKEVKALGHMIVPVFTATPSNPLLSQWIPFTEALLCVKNLFYFYYMAQYPYHTEAMINYMDNYLAESHCHKDVFGGCRGGKSTKKVSESMKWQRTLDKQGECESDPVWNNLSVAAKYWCVVEAQTPIELEIAQHLVDKLDFNFVKMHLLSHFHDCIGQLQNFLNASSALTEMPMMYLQQAYRHSNRHEAVFQILWTKARKGLFQYLELNANAAHNVLTMRFL